MSVVHLCPPGDEGVMPCCGKTPLEVSVKDNRLTSEPDLVTCPGFRLPEDKMAKLLSMGLAGCTKVIAPEEADDRATIVGIVIGLAMCPHGHTYALVNEGKLIVTDQESLDCLREKGIKV